MGHIFISYSHKDKEYVEKLEQKLLEEGFNAWIDHRIDYGSRWTAEIENAIDTCDAYIVVMSEDAKKSEWVQREVIHAERRKKPFFPLLLRGEFWFSLGNIQYFDVTDGSIPTENFYRNLKNVTQRSGMVSSNGHAYVDKMPRKDSKPISTHRRLPYTLVVGLVALFIFIISLLYVPKIMQYLSPVEVDRTFTNTPSHPIESPTEPKVFDSDDDGISDSDDLCPTQGDLGYGIDALGCPNSPSDTEIPYCPGSLDTRVEVGMTIEVTTDQVNPVPKLGIRPQPTLDARKEFELLSGERMLVLDGPECSHDSYFWYITSQRGDGWVREGNTEFYFVDPIQ